MPGLSDFGRATLDAGLDLTSRISPYYWIPTLLIAFAVRAALEPSERAGFFHRLFPFREGDGRSHLVDFAMMVTGFVVQATGVLSFTGLTTLFAVLVMDAVGGPAKTIASGLWVGASVTVITAVTADFCTYCVHRVHHRVPVLWPFHAVHHSAEIMSPVTFYRKHPVYDAIHSLFTAILGGALQGLLLALFVGKPTPLFVGNANAIYFLFNLAGSNLRHSHVWLSYGPSLSKWLISPTMHQVHHSRAARHHDKNFGEVFAVWDRMFGTLHVPVAPEVLDFGLADASGNSLPQPHGGVVAALLHPFRASAAALADSFVRRAQ
jgi:sterol desaturase/sphingolipid hydroxylase (fatty acid hydroxylase superfamily)